MRQGVIAPKGLLSERKIFFEIYQALLCRSFAKATLVGFIRISDFTNFPASTGFLVMVKKELPVLRCPVKLAEGD